MMADPFLIEGPAPISFSGGRTSAYMLWRVLEAHGGTLPDDVHVTFANTGKEREETLRFVHECGTRWGVQVRWLEWAETAAGFEEVGYNSADRVGRVFEALLHKKGLLPNVSNVFCSIELKQRTCRKFAASLGWGRYKSAVGLRYDERHRVKGAEKRAASKKDAWSSVCPLFDAKVTKLDVLAFWAAQDFDLGLRNFEGNYDGCFQKGPRLYEVERHAPGTLDWWIAQEKRLASIVSDPSGAQWVLGRSYAEIQEALRRQPDLFDGAFGDEINFDAECSTAGCPTEQALFQGRAAA